MCESTLRSGRLGWREAKWREVSIRTLADPFEVRFEACLWRVVESAKCAKWGLRQCRCLLAILRTHISDCLSAYPMTIWHIDRTGILCRATLSHDASCHLSLQQSESVLHRFLLLLETLDEMIGRSTVAMSFRRRWPRSRLRKKFAAVQYLVSLEPRERPKEKMTARSRRPEAVIRLVCVIREQAGP